MYTHEPWCHCGCSMQILDGDGEWVATVSSSLIEVFMRSLDLTPATTPSTPEILSLDEALEWTFQVGIADLAGARSAASLVNMLEVDQQGPWRKKLANAWFK